MSAFTIVHHDRITGKLTCFDRLIFKGHLIRFFQPNGMKMFLDSQGVLLKDFAGYVTKMSAALKAHAMESAARAGRPYEYLGKAHTKRQGTSKEDLARQIAETGDDFLRTLTDDGTALGPAPTPASPLPSAPQGGPQGTPAGGYGLAAGAVQPAA